MTRLLAPGVTLSDAFWRVVGITWALLLAWTFVVADRDHRRVFTSVHECGTDPRDFFRAGELLEAEAVRFIVEAHCANARYSPDGWIELKFGGGAVDVETRKLDVAGGNYYEIISVGGTAEP